MIHIGEAFIIVPRVFDFARKLGSYCRII